MSENHQGGPQPGVASMVGDILEDAQKLVRQEIGLAQHEVAQAWDTGKTGIMLLAAAAGAFGVGGVLCATMVVKLLHALMPNHEWACFGIVGGSIMLLGGALFYLGLHWINQVHVSLPRTTEPLPEQVRTVRAAVPVERPSSDLLLKP